MQVVEQQAGQPLPDCGAQQLDQHRRHRLHRRHLAFDRAGHLGEKARIGRHGAEHRPALAEAVHQAGQCGQWHLVVARACPQHQHAGPRLGQRVEQAALAGAGLPADDEQVMRSPGVSQGQQFGAAADELRWPQRRGRQGLARHPGVGQRLLDGVQQGQRVGAGPRAHLVLQGAFAVVECQQRAGPVTAQVVQPHHVAVRRFVQPIEPQQRLRHRQRGGQLTGLFEGAGLALERAAGGVDAALALAAQPGVERRRVGELQVAEHAFGIGEVVRHAVGQAQRRAAHARDGDQFAAVALQVEEPLAQRVAGRRRVAARPQKLGELRPRGRAFEREPGQQGGIARGQRAARTIGMRGQRKLGQFKVHGVGRG